MADSKKAKNDEGLSLDQQVAQLNRSISGLKGHNKRLKDLCEKKDARIKELSEAIIIQQDTDATMIQKLKDENEALTKELEKRKRPWWRKLCF